MPAKEDLPTTGVSGTASNETFLNGANPEDDVNNCIHTRSMRADLKIIAQASRDTDKEGDLCAVGGTSGGRFWERTSLPEVCNYLRGGSELQVYGQQA